MAVFTVLFVYELTRSKDMGISIVTGNKNKSCKWGFVDFRNLFINIIFLLLFQSSFGRFYLLISNNAITTSLMSIILQTIKGNSYQDARVLRPASCSSRSEWLIGGWNFIWNHFAKSRAKKSFGKFFMTLYRTLKRSFKIISYLYLIQYYTYPIIWNLNGSFLKGGWYFTFHLVEYIV